MSDKQNTQLPDEYYCIACGRFSVHTVGLPEEVNGNLYDSNVDDADALAEVSQRFKSHVLMHCDGMISRACLEEYAGKEISQPTSPLSKLFASRVRGRRCDHCGHISKMSRLP